MLVNIRKVNLPKWIRNPKNIYIGRRTNFLKGSKWANPYRISCTNSREQVVERFSVYIRNNRKLLREIHQLKGKVLGCWCVPKLCHGQVLQQLVQVLTSGVQMYSSDILHPMDKAQWVIEAATPTSSNAQTATSPSGLPIINQVSQPIMSTSNSHTSSLLSSITEIMETTEIITVDEEIHVNAATIKVYFERRLHDTPVKTIVESLNADGVMID